MPRFTKYAAQEAKLASLRKSPAYRDARQSGFSHAEAMAEAKAAQAKSKRQPKRAKPAPKPAAKAKTATAGDSVYTPESPPQTGPSEIAKLDRLGLLRPGYVHPEQAAAYNDWWQASLAERDAAELERLNTAIRENNIHVASLANPLDLDVKQLGGILQFDPLAMARRIEAAAAQHKNRAKGPRGHRNANRHLRYVCPECQKPVRVASSDKILLCGGIYTAQHAPTLMVFDESSQPAYRLQDKYAGAEGTDLDGQEAGLQRPGSKATSSQIQLAAASKRQVSAPTTPTDPATPAEHQVIPF